MVERWNRVLIWLVVATACGSVRQELPDAAPPDAPSSNDGSTCYGTGIVRICVASPPSQSIVVAAPMAIDTAQGFSCAAVSGGDGDCVIVATDIVIGQTLRATGPRPLVLVASGSITVSAGALIDVGSHRGATPETGAGADPAGCGAGTSPIASPQSGNGGGGAGGSFVGKGGGGGDGGAAGSANKGGIAAAVVMPAAVDHLRGGCAGQSGAGAPVAAMDSSAPGHGGGAVFLIAGRMIDVQGGINAVGEGGGGGPPTQFGGCGGGGGGAGGMIGLDAPMIRSTGVILASGGGGGGGGGNPGTYYGADGASPTTTVAAAGGRGGRDGIVGGNGGTGSSTTAAASDGSHGNNDSVSIGGGGGGGGGAGLIKAPLTADLGINVSPAPTP